MKCGNCAKCERLLKSTSVAVTGTAPNKELQITIAKKALVNLENYCFIICQTIPDGSADLPVVVLNGTTAIPACCKKGNNLQGWQIRSRRKYKVVYGNDESHILFYNHETRRC